MRLLLFLIVVGIAHAADVVDPNVFPRVIGTDVGVPGGIPTTRTNLINVTQAPYNADNTGATDASTAINSAITAAVANDIVYLPAGTYRLDSQVSIGPSKANITLRGAGATTIISPRSIAYGIFIGAGEHPGAATWANNFYAVPATNNVVTAGATAGSTALTIADTTDFTAGQLIQVSVSNQDDNAAIEAGAMPIIDFGGSGDVIRRRQLTRLVSKTSTVLTISPALHYTPDANLTMRVNYAPGKSVGIGIEDMKIDMNDSTAIGAVVAWQAYGCWVKNVEVANLSNYGIDFESCLQSEIRHCYVHERKTGGSNGAGILMNQAGNCLIEDNIVYDVFPCIEMNSSSTGNVLGYNFTYMLSSANIDINHGPWNSFNLFEGNVTINITSDGYFGGASNNTIYRNWVTAQAFFESVDADKNGSGPVLKRATYRTALIGNIWGSANYPFANNPSWPYGNVPYSLGEPNIGNNNSIGTAQPSAGDFWVDWKKTGTLTTRTSDSVGVVTVSAIGNIVVSTNFYIYWQTGGQWVYLQVTPTSIDGLAVTVTVVSGFIATVLPAASTAFEVWTHAAGFQEIDYDVYRTTDPTTPGSTYVKGNYWNLDGTPTRNYIPSSNADGATDESLGSDTLADSFYTTKAAMEARGVSWGALPFPPFDPTSPGDVTVAGLERIPAGYRYINGIDPPPADTVATPTFDPVAGTYSGTQNVTIASATAGATFYYTVDGTTPTDESTLYSGPVAIASTLTLKAIGTKVGLIDSAVASGLYTITAPGGTTIDVIGTTTVTGTLTLP